MKYPVEALLRAPVEFWSASVALMCAIVCVACRDLLAIPHFALVGFIVALTTLSLVRVFEAVAVIRYQRGLLQSSAWTMRSDRVPRKKGLIYLGEGFKWTQKHTQRLVDTIRPEGRKYVQTTSPTLISEWVSRLGDSDSKAPDTNQLSISGRPELHGVEPNKSHVWMNAADRVGHTLVLGTTRVGKTRFSELLISQDIRNGNVVLVFDPKGDVDLLRRTYAEAKRCGREKQFVMFHLGYPEHSCRYNAIGRFSRITEVATRISSQLPGQGSSSAFREFAWRFVNIIAHALVELRQVPNYLKIRKYINDIEPLFVDYARSLLMRTEPAGWASEVKDIERSLNPRTLPTALKARDPQAVALYKYVQERDIDDPVLEGLISAFKYDRTYFDKIVSSVGPLMEKLTTGAVAELISPNETAKDPRPMMEWLSVIRNGGIVYIGLDALSDSTVAAAVGNSMFADLVSVAGYLYKFGIDGEGKPYRAPPRVCIHADEFNELIGDEFVPLLNKSGGAGFQVTAYTQTLSDVEARVGARARAGQVTGNFNSLFMLRVKELATAELLTSQLPKVEIRGLSASSSASDIQDIDGKLHFQTRNDDRLSSAELPLLSPSDIVSLPRGQAFALLDGGNLWKVRFPLPDARDPWMPRDLSELTAALTENYQEQVSQNKLGGDLTARSNPVAE